ncbi:hypothetical protein ACP275_12G139400 [Erythranthe tilingii]
MSVEGNADSNWSEKKVEGEDSLRTVDCLRGRLLSERVASKNANEEAEHLGNKLMELETLLKQEAESRNRAEKRLKLLMKKLQSMNISYISDESGYSCSVEKSDVSSVSSSTTSSSSTTKQLQENYENRQIEIEGRGLKENLESSSKVSENLQQNDSQNSSSSIGDKNPTTEETSGAAFEIQEQKCETETNAVSENLAQIVAQNATIKMDEQSGTSSTEEELNQESERQIDNSMAIVSIDMPLENNKVDPEVLDATVKEVLDALRHAKEQLQSSMERRRRTNMISVG